MHPYNNNDLTVTDVNYQLTSSYTTPSLTVCGSNYSVSGDYLFRKKHESNKERLIRQRAAFKLFYPNKVIYTVKKTEKDFSAEHNETVKRESKFKNINLNLII